MSNPSNLPAGAAAQGAGQDFTLGTPPTEGQEPDGYVKIGGNWVPYYNSDPADFLLYPGQYEEDGPPQK